MLGLRKKGPNREFTHAPDRKIMAVDPTTEIRWSEMERGHWQAECRCGTELARSARRRSSYSARPL
jgi:hypothetical protein